MGWRFLVLGGMLAASLVLIADPVAAAPPHPPTAVTVTVTNNSVTATVTPGTAGGGCAPTHNAFFVYHATLDVLAKNSKWGNYSG